MKPTLTRLKQVWKEEEFLNSNFSIDIPSTILQDCISNMFCPGPFYYYIFNFTDFTFDYVHPNVQEVLGVETEGLTTTDLTERLHPDDREYMATCEQIAGDFLFRRISKSDIVNYKVCYSYRVKMNNGVYEMLLHQARALTVDQTGAISKAFGVHTNVEHLMPHNNYKISFIGLNGARSYLSLDVPRRDAIGLLKHPYSPRELQIIRLLSEGMNAEAIAAALEISKETVRTHRKNILRKSGSENTVQAVAKCIREGII